MTTYEQSVEVIITPWVEVVSATGSSTGVTYTIKSGKTVPFAVGDQVSIEGFTNSAYNTSSGLVTTVTSTTFKITGPSATSGTTSSFTGGLAGLALGVNVAGQDVNIAYNNGLIDSVRVRGGRADITSQPEAMTATVDIILDSATTYSPNLNQLMIVQVYDYPSSSYKRLFVGGITDIDVSVDSWFDAAGTYRYSITAASMLQKFQFRATTYNSSSIIASAGYYAGDWLGTALTSPDIDGWFAGYGTITDNSTLMHKRSAGTYYDYDIATSAASSARGNLHDRPDGKIYYTTFSASSSPTFYSLGTSVIMADGLSAQKSITEIVNTALVTSTNNAITTATASDTTSQNAFGRRRGTKDTEADVQATIDGQATDYLAARKSPKWRYGSIVIDLASPNLTDADRQQLYTTRTNTAYSIAFPTQLGGTTNVLVDNWSWSFTRGRSTLTMQVCPFTDLHP